MAEYFRKSLGSVFRTCKIDKEASELTGSLENQRKTFECKKELLELTEDFQKWQNIFENNSKFFKNGTELSELTQKLQKALGPSKLKKYI